MQLLEQHDANLHFKTGVESWFHIGCYTGWGTSFSSIFAPRTLHW